MAVIEHLTLRVSPELKELLKEAAYASRMSINHKANEILAEALEPQTQGTKTNGGDTSLRCAASCTGHQIDGGLYDDPGQCVLKMGHNDKHFAMHGYGGCEWEG